MSDMNEIILDSTNKIFRDYCTKELIDEVEDGNSATELWNTLEELGITNISIAEEFGGVGGEFKDAFNILQLAGKYAAPVPIAETLLTKWLSTSFGADNSEIAEGSYTYAIDFNNRFSLREDGDNYVISGSNENVPWARSADKILLLAELNNKSVVLTVSREEAKIEKNINLAGEHSDTVSFENVTLNNVAVNEVDEDVFKNKFLMLGTIAKSAKIAGALDRVFELTIQYVKEREQFGRQLYRFQAVQQQIAQVAGEVSSALMGVAQTIELYNHNPEAVTFELPILKMRLNESAGIVSDIAHQLHGAIGMTHEHRLHQFTRRLWAWRNDFGNEEFWSEKLANVLLENKETNVWELITENKFI